MLPAFSVQGHGKVADGACVHRRGAEQSGRAARAPGDDIPLGALVSGNRWERGRLVRRRAEMSDSLAEALRDSTLPRP